MSNEWRESVWSCFSPAKACFLGACCPCLIYGQQSERLEDPALKEGGYVNGDCCLFVLANYCCLSWVLMMMKRRDLREKFGLKGSVGEDCILSCLCPCCVLVQQEKELDAQAQRLQTQTGYQPPASMAYPPENKQIGTGTGTATATNGATLSPDLSAGVPHPQTTGTAYADTTPEYPPANLEAGATHPKQ